MINYKKFDFWIGYTGVFIFGLFLGVLITWILGTLAYKDYIQNPKDCILSKSVVEQKLNENPQFKGGPFQICVQLNQKP